MTVRLKKIVHLKKTALFKQKHLKGTAVQDNDLNQLFPLQLTISKNLFPFIKVIP